MCVCVYIYIYICIPELCTIDNSALLGNKNFVFVMVTLLCGKKDNFFLCGEITSLGFDGIIS